MAPMNFTLLPVSGIASGAIKRRLFYYCVQPNLRLQFSTVIIDSLEYNFFPGKAGKEKPFSQMKGGQREYS